MRSTYFNCHNHTIYSNIRLLDCINRPKNLIYRAIDLGLDGIAITDHECLSSHVEVNKIMEEVQKTNPNFKIALGNEIYLTEDRKSGQKYFHFILIAKDALGHRALRELSSTSWFYSYVDRGMERVPTLKSELKDICKRFKGHLIATTACLGGELSSLSLQYLTAEKNNDLKEMKESYSQICSFVDFCKELFEDDFYIECQPATTKEQISVNKKLAQIAKYYNIKMVVGTDSHYLSKEDRYVHKSYLNSQDGEREVDDFYEFAYLMSPEEVRQLLRKSFDEDYIDIIFNNSLEIKNKITHYSLFSHQDIPRVEVYNYPKGNYGGEPEKYPMIDKLLWSNDEQDRYWINQCIGKLNQLGKINDERYLIELEEEAKVKSIISEKLNTNMFRYPNTLQHYIDMIWDCGSMVGAGRGSSCAALNHFLLGER